MALLKKISEDKNLKLNPGLTSSGIPVLTRDTKSAFVEEMERNIAMGKSRAEIIREISRKIQKENPLIMESIRELVHYSRPGSQYEVAISLISLYSLLDSQGMRDKIWAYFSKAE